MMFLLKAAFWLGLVLVLLPSGPKEPKAEAPQVSALAAASAASAAVSDLSQFCTRQPETCSIGSSMASILTQRAQDGALMVYEFITDRRETAAEESEAGGVAHLDPTGSIPAGDTSGMIPRARPMHSQDTLTTVDRQPVWRQPGSSKDIQLARHD